MDLKPSNLLIKGSNPPILKVADFGFAQHLEEDSKDKGLKGDNFCCEVQFYIYSSGSPLYMAPEIFLSDQYDAKADLWSIGVILYEVRPTAKEDYLTEIFSFSRQYLVERPSAATLSSSLLLKSKKTSQL